MRFLLDHDVPDRVAQVLRQSGHSVIFLRDALAATAPDHEVLAYAAGERLILITCNRDHFLRLAQTQSHSGLIVLIRRNSRIAECAHLLRLIARAGESGLSQNINFA